MSQAKPCPFCGGSAELKSTGNRGSFWYVSWYQCIPCEARGSWSHDAARALDLWNRRTAPELPPDPSVAGKAERHG